MSDFFRLEDDAPARRIVYTAALLLIAVPLVQVGSQLWPLQLASIQWRFGAANALSAVLLLPFLGVTLICMTARATDSRGFSRAVGVLTAIFSLTLAASAAVFVLDALQLKTIVQSRMMDQFNTTFVRVTALAIVFAIAYGLLAFACFRFPKGKVVPARGVARAKADEPVTLIVGQGGARTE